MFVAPLSGPRRLLPAEPRTRPWSAGDVPPTPFPHSWTLLSPSATIAVSFPLLANTG